MTTVSGIQGFPALNRIGSVVLGCLVILGSVAMGIDLAPSTQPAAPSKAEFVKNLEAGRPQKVVFYGTSLTRGGAWPGQVSAVIEKQFPKLATFSNGAKGGENSTWGLANVQKFVIDQKPDVVFIEFTTNDAVDRFDLSLADAKKNTEGIIDAILKDRPGCEIILQIMNPVIDRPVGTAGSRAHLDDYQQMYRDLAKERGFRLIDHTPAWKKVLAQGEETYKKYVPDGLHPNPEGYSMFVTPTILNAIGVTVAPTTQK